MTKKFAMDSIVREIEEHIADVRIKSAVKRLDPVRLVLNDTGFGDEDFGAETGFEPFSLGDDQVKQDTSWPEEIRKHMNLNLPEFQNLYNPIVDEESRQRYIDETEFKLRLFEAKWEWLKDRTLGQYKLTTEEVANKKKVADEYDRWIKPRVEFMYNYLDFDNERHAIRNRFLHEMNKKTTVKDIGEKLDEFTWSSKSATMMAGYWHNNKHILEQPLSATKD